jgi:hypothetical protein
MKNTNYVIRIFTAIFLAGAVCFTASAQRDEDISTLFGDKKGSVDHGGWGGLTFGYTKINEKDTYLMGARGGWLIDHHLTIGLAGYGFISDKTFYVPEAGADANLAGGYGGLFLEANIAPYYPVHVTIPLIIGAGGVTYADQKWWEGNDYNYPASSIDSDAYFVLEPGLEIEINLIKFMRLGIGGSYRYTSQVTMVNSSGSMLQGWNGYFNLKFGWF